MKHIHTFESFLNESYDPLSYWTQYADGNGQEPKWYNDEVKRAADIPKLVNKVIMYDSAESDVPFDVDPKDEKSLVNLATMYFNKFKTINGNIISAMLFQGA